MNLNKKFGSKQNTKHESFKIAQKSKSSALGQFYLKNKKIHVYCEGMILHSKLCIVPVWRLLALYR